MSTIGTPDTNEPPLSHRPGWDYTYHLLLIRGATPQILLVRDEEGWALPRFRPTEHDLRAVAHIERAVRQSLGLETRVLRCLSVDRSQAQAKRVETVFVLEVLTDAPPFGADLRWAEATNLEKIPMTSPAQRGLVAQWLHPSDGVSQATTNYPWVLPGWQVEAVAWVGEQLGRHGGGPIAAIGQVRTWALSCVLHIDTPQGAYYLKALPPAYRPEVAVTNFLAAHFPECIPQVIAADLARGWLLLADVGPLMENDRLDLWERIVIQIAAMQRAAIPAVAPLLALGCADQRLDALAAQAGGAADQPAYPRRPPRR